MVEDAIAITAANIGTALALHRCVSRPRSTLVRVLDQPAVVALGVVSYSLYLWQQPFLNHHLSVWWCKPPVNLVLAGTCAVASYLAIERPALGLGRRFRH